MIELKLGTQMILGNPLVMVFRNGELVATINCRDDEIVVTSKWIKNLRDATEAGGEFHSMDGRTIVQIEMELE